MISDFTKNVVDAIKNDRAFAAQVKLPEGAKVVGVCPECGNPVIETEKAFGCSNWKNGCRFTVWKNDKYICK